MQNEILIQISSVNVKHRVEQKIYGFKRLLCNKYCVLGFSSKRVLLRFYDSSRFVWSLKCPIVIELFDR